MYVRAKETVYYGEVRRYGPVYEDLPGGRKKKVSDGDIFKLRERRGKDAKNKPVVLTVAMQLRTIQNAVEVISVSENNFEEVKRAEIEARRVDNFEREQAEIDEIDAIKTVADLELKGEGGRMPTIEEQLDDENIHIITDKEMNDLNESTKLKSDEEPTQEPLSDEAIAAAAAKQAADLSRETVGGVEASMGTGSEDVLS